MDDSSKRTICAQAADADVLEKAVDCLRILTTGNDSNKVALFTIPAGVPSLVRLLSTSNPDQVTPATIFVLNAACRGIGHLDLGLTSLALRHQDSVLRFISW